MTVIRTPADSTSKTMNSEEVKAEYSSSLKELKINSKPLISFLTMLAEDNLAHAADIVAAIEEHLEKDKDSDAKLPVLYLIDCITKNIGRTYTALFSQNIVKTFCNVFKVADEKTRAEMFKLRQTWNDIFPAMKLYAIDVQIHVLDPAWPVTAKPPAVPIHFNPKFLSSTKPQKEKPAVVSAIPIASELIPQTPDSETFAMQQQLIQKQKELIELQQKKLELELLQTQVKLQKQLKTSSKTSSSGAVSQRPQNILLKPEVAKQLLPVTSAMGRDMSKKPGAMNQRFPSQGPPAAPRITPVNSALVATAMRPTRDPRLLRQQNLNKASSSSNNNNNANNSANNSISSSVSLSLESNRTAVLDSDKNNVTAAPVTTNKMSVRDSVRNEPRLVLNSSSNKDNVPSSPTKSSDTSKSNKPFPKSRPPSDHKSAHHKLPRIGKITTNTTTTTTTITNTDSDIRSLSSKSSSSGSTSSLLESPTKSKNSDKSESSSKSSSGGSTKSPTKHKKKDYNSSGDGNKKSSKEFRRERGDSGNKSGGHKNNSTANNSDTNSASSAPAAAASALAVAVAAAAATAAPAPHTQTAPPNFKNVKGSAKNRNYIRRHRSPSFSPEPPQITATTQDVDLRIVGPPEKQQRYQPLPLPPQHQHQQPEVVTTTVLAPVIEDKKTDVPAQILPPQGMDVDLRELPPAPIAKKRPSMEGAESSAPKKSKTEIFDVLFGNEDTDLRQQLPPVVTNDRPPTPPPPIISSGASEKEKEPSPKKSSNLDLVRAKLANATGRDKVLAKSFRKKRPELDEDLRFVPQPQTPLGGEAIRKIIISPDDEQCIKAGTMTKEQEQQLMSKIIAQIEHQKLQEAQRKDKEESAESLQPVSDDELEFNDEKEDTVDEPSKFGDRDERVNQQPKFVNNRDARESRRGAAPYWRGTNKRRHWDNSPYAGGPPPPPHPRPPINRPWMGPAPQQQLPIPPSVNPWRQIGPSAGNMPPVVPPPAPQNFFRPIAPEFAEFPPQQQQQDTGKRSPPNAPSPPVDLVVDSVHLDDIKTINIDGVPRDIRYYDETAVIFMNWDEPREISFQNGSRRVVFDDKDVYFLSFNEPYTELSISGVMHKVRLGGPSREIFIDCKPYECYFGGPGITIDLNGQMTSVKLDGPPPQVKIGNTRRLDLVAGRVNMIINAKIIVPVFLDAKVQKFVIDGESHTLKFVDALKTVLINDVPFDVEFGGLPKPITVHDKKHFIRFSVLPRGVKPGSIKIKDMEGSLRASPVGLDENSQDRLSPSNHDLNEPTRPAHSRRRKQIEDDAERNSSNSPHFFQNFMQHSNLDMLSSVMTSSMAPPTPTTPGGGYQVEMAAVVTTSGNSQDSQHNTLVTSEATLPRPSNGSNQQSKVQLPPALNINELFQKLVATGIVASSTNINAGSKQPLASTTAQREPPSLSNENSSSQPPMLVLPPTATAATPAPAFNNKPLPPPPLVRRNPLEHLRPVTFNRPETLKLRQGFLYEALYAGMQCSSCGMRFPPEQTMHYSQHLDWHFRQNRKGKKNIRVAASRKWYYGLGDWKNYEEIEDLEEREKNYFDQQQSQVQNAGEEAEEESEIPSVPAIPDVQDVYCDVCQDKFDQFFNEDKEEWHLRNAVREDGRTYHPVCYEDYKTSLLHPRIETIEDDSIMKDEQENKTDIIPGLEIILDDDDDEDMPAAQVVIEESDESKAPSVDDSSSRPATAAAADEQQQSQTSGDDNNAAADGNTNCENSSENLANQNNDEGEDDDVIINEVIPERIEVDDDDDYKEYMSPSTMDQQRPVKVEKIDDDGFVDVEEALLNIKGGIKIKSEPLDPEELIELEEAKMKPDTAHTGLMTSSIDGNIELVSNVPTSTASLCPNKIKINISKPLSHAPTATVMTTTVAPQKEHFEEVTAHHSDSLLDSTDLLDPVIDPSQPLPPGVEPPVQLHLKPALVGVKLTKMPPVCKGSELTGMCSIM